MTMDNTEAKKEVRKAYGLIAKEAKPCCGPAKTCCGNSVDPAVRISKNIGYDDEDIGAVPDGANLGLGCGNPIAFAELQPGETVLDLGSGAGFDCFLASKVVGENGSVIGVDMTPEMLEKARSAAQNEGYDNVEFRMGEIENLPVANDTADVVISNCVINLVPDKLRAFTEAYRALKPGGRLMVSDIVLEKELPDYLRQSVSAYVGCISGAVLKHVYLDIIRSVGFRDVEVLEESHFSIESMLNDPSAKAVIEKTKVTPEQAEMALAPVLSMRVRGVKGNGD